MAIRPFQNLALKVVSVVLAALLWLIVSGEQTVERVLRIPLEYTNIPEQLELVGEPPTVVDVRGTTIGAGGEHPSLSEHSIRYIALYINTAEISRVYLHPVYSAPKVTFSIALDEGGSLRAIAEPNHSAGWEAAKKINVVR